MKIIKTALIVIAVLVLVVIVGLIILFIYINHHNENYYKYAVTGGEIEEKYTALGPYDVSYIDFDAGNDIYKKYEIWYPTDMINSDQTYPLVVMANGTGVKASQYKEVFQHLSSWGFIVIGNEDENSRTGASSAASLDFALSLNGDSNSIFYKKIDVDNIGIAGHSQGGVGAVNAVTNQENGKKYKALFTASMTSPYWGQDDVFGKEWSYDFSKVNIPCFMVAGTGKADAGTAIDITAKEGQGICPLWGLLDNYSSIPDSVSKIMARQVGKDHGDMLRSADGYMTAWFIWHLKDDNIAQAAFIGESAEIINNSNWQNIKTNLSNN